jgi:tRNA-splicing ligase RtcB (3'-phosphate/5'-hydroxy nucleic acid ligase)
MIELKGKHNECKIFTDKVEEGCIELIQKILDNPDWKDTKLRFMPDIHLGKGTCIGTTMTITDKVVPNFVSVDVGCGVIVQTLKDKHIELCKLDKIMHNIVPSGFAINSKPHRFANQIDITKLKCYSALKNHHKFLLGIGSLGGGNHYCEVNKDETGQLFLVIHTGSRNLGKQIADYYQQKAYEELKNNTITKDEIIAQLCHLGREQDIERTLKSVDIPKIDKSMAYCEGQLMDDYLHDMAIAQEYASLNRKAIADIIQRGMGWKVQSEFQTIHNYIDMDTKILRKGAVSAKKGEILVIPISPSYGSLICVGLGNEDWNYSAPHGGGRAMSRKVAKEKFTTDDFKKAMEGIYTTTISKDTIDECPMAYKNPKEIIENIKDTVNVVNHIVPVYNFKGS